MDFPTILSIFGFHVVLTYVPPMDTITSLVKQVAE